MEFSSSTVLESIRGLVAALAEKKIGKETAELVSLVRQLDEGMCAGASAPEAWTGCHPSAQTEQTEAPTFKVVGHEVEPVQVMKAGKVVEERREISATVQLGAFFYNCRALQIGEGPVCLVDARKALVQGEKDGPKTYTVPENSKRAHEKTREQLQAGLRSFFAPPAEETPAPAPEPASEPAPAPAE